ncbi:MAG: 30S ribosomal protein S12 methylthiotransferase RimO [Nitrospirae bacterium]|nr:30S ribosomal protein S12 methylthiotransferase RimO [Nitrospirota bacterium]
MKYAIVSLGCPKNQVDSENLILQLGISGHSRTAPEDADVILINTCSFIESAKTESVETILEAAATGKRVIAFGCLPARYRDELAREMPEIEAFFGVGENQRIIKQLGRAGAAVETLSSRPLLNAPHFAYLKIAEGCDNRCTYCVIPSIRGPYISRPSAEIFQEARALAQSGVKELIVVAQDTTAYGRDIGENIAGLLEKLSALDIPWIRLMYAYPEAVTDELLDVMRGAGNICAYLDMPLQHSDAGVLKRMGRRPVEGGQLRLIEKIRSKLPDIAIRSTFIVGFPGETDAEFDGLLAFLREARLDRVGAFAYSREEGTPAARMKGQIGAKRRKDRLERLMAAQAAISFERNSGLIGRTLNVLIDEREGDTAIGRTCADAPEIDCGVIVHGAGNARAGDFARVRITEAQDYDIAGVITKEGR